MGKKLNCHMLRILLMRLHRPRKAHLFAIAFVERSDQSRHIGDSLNQAIIEFNTFVPGVPRPVKKPSTEWKCRALYTSL